MSSQQCRIEFNLHILKVFELNRDTCSPPLALPSLSPKISLALLKLKCVLKHTSVFQNLFDSLKVTYSCWHLTLSVKHINCLPALELNSYKVIIIFVIIKPLHPKLAHVFGYRMSLSASVRCYIIKARRDTTRLHQSGYRL